MDHTRRAVTDLPGVAESVDQLAERLRPYNVSAICGPFVGCAFLALLLAERLNAKFVYTQSAGGSSDRMFGARYSLTPELARQVEGHRVAVVDDMISAGSSVRASIDAIHAAHASVVVVGCLTLLGTNGKDYFEDIGIPLEYVDTQALTMWLPADCPLCAAGAPLETR
jgi:orotate phosphoribosyltransferase